MKETVSILNQALLTEKATMLSANLNKYSFIVSSSASRTNVKTAVENAFGVKVLKVNVLNVKPKAKRDRTRRNKQGFTSGFKKAVITLQAGDSIDLA
ncbi:MAG: 50S ribosomal protein L23 [Opitutae bacterium]|jgi:large subunit ribosomal protein L23|nr:50S ribosomal protein L23 [Opitutae bacterium]|tara:strand:- start:14768 stop:15058 length:291 start_codon:yes stop_codon:yes gene_type:complete